MAEIFGMSLNKKGAIFGVLILSLVLAHSANSAEGDELLSPQAQNGQEQTTPQDIATTQSNQPQNDAMAPQAENTQAQNGQNIEPQELQKDTKTEVVLPLGSYLNSLSNPNYTNSIQPPNGGNSGDIYGEYRNADSAFRSGIVLSERGDYFRAYDMFLSSCKGGNAQACLAIGFMNMNGIGTMKNPVLAIEYYQKACSGGDAMACANLALAYDNGNSVPVDKSKAAELYLVGCEGGDMLACTNLAWMYANGQGVGKDYQRAIGYYRFACDNGSSLGCYNLGLMSNVNNIYGADRDSLGLEEINKLACDSGDNIGCANLGWIYLHGIGNVKQSFYNAAKYFDTACSSGIISSCNNLGVLYEREIGRASCRERVYVLV